MKHEYRMQIDKLCISSKAGINVQIMNLMQLNRNRKKITSYSQTNRKLVTVIKHKICNRNLNEEVIPLAAKTLI